MGRKLNENLVAISAEFHTHDKYKEFYDKHCDALSGFPGIWNYVSDIGEAFSRAERKMRIQWDDGWIEAIMDVVAMIYKEGLEQDNILSGDELDTKVQEALRLSLEWTNRPAEPGSVWTREPGHPPVRVGPWYVLQMTGVEYESVQDDTEHYLLPDGSWTGLERMDVLESAQKFKTPEEAKAAMGNVGEEETVTLIKIEANGDMTDVEVLHEGKTLPLQRSEQDE